MSDTGTTQRLDAIDERLSQLTGAVDVLVTQFLRPLAQQSVANQQAIAQLIERSERHQEWLDEDRHDLAAWREAQAEQSRQIQSLLDSARADRMSANERFEQMQSEIRQNQRLLLAGQERLERNEQRLDRNQQQLMRSEQRLEANQQQLVRNEQRLDRNQQQIAATLAEVLSLSRRVQAVEDVA